jgi:hypothetical protein
MCLNDFPAEFILPKKNRKAVRAFIEGLIQNKTIEIKNIELGEPELVIHKPYLGYVQAQAKTTWRQKWDEWTKHPAA